MDDRVHRWKWGYLVKTVKCLFFESKQILQCIRCPLLGNEPLHIDKEVKYFGLIHHVGGEACGFRSPFSQDVPLHWGFITWSEQMWEVRTSWLFSSWYLKSDFHWAIPNFVWRWDERTDIAWVTTSWLESRVLGLRYIEAIQRWKGGVKRDLCENG